MISFKVFFENTTAGVITPSDIYTFYYIYHSKNILLNSEYNREIIVNFLNSLKSKYLNTFGTVLKEQILKYLRYQASGQKRIRDDAELLTIDVSEFSGNPIIDFDKLEKFIKETTRSARHNFKSNEDWNQFSEWVNKLSKKTISAGGLNIEGSDNVLFIIDRINNCVHNTGESIFDKVRENGHALIQAFEQAHIARDIKVIKAKALPEIKELEISSTQENVPSVSNTRKQDTESMHSFYKGRFGD